MQLFCAEAKGLKEKMRERRRNFAALQVAVKAVQPDRIAVGSDRRVEFQFAMHCLHRLGLNPKGIYLDDGLYTYAGRPAWFLLLLAAVAAALRGRFRNGWRIVHYLTCVALAFGAVHATMLGTSFVVSTVAHVVMLLLAALGLLVFVRKRVEAWQRRRARAARR